MLIGQVALLDTGTTAWLGDAWHDEGREMGCQDQSTLMECCTSIAFQTCSTMCVALPACCSLIMLASTVRSDSVPQDFVGLCIGTAMWMPLATEGVSSMQSGSRLLKLSVAGQASAARPWLTCMNEGLPGPDVQDVTSQAAPLNLGSSAVAAAQGPAQQAKHQQAASTCLQGSTSAHSHVRSPPMASEAASATASTLQHTPAGAGRVMRDRHASTNPLEDASWQSRRSGLMQTIWYSAAGLKRRAPA